MHFTLLNVFERHTTALSGTLLYIKDDLGMENKNPFLLSMLTEIVNIFDMSYF
jgi:hypothetical protein